MHLDLRSLLVLLCSINFVVQTAHIVSSPELTTDPIPCQTDTDCPNTSYCFSISQECTNCFNCASHFRQTRVKCARVVQDCGDCLPGYVEQTYSRFPSDRRWCKEIIKMTAEPQKLDDAVFVTFDSKWLGVFLFCCVALSSFASYHCYYTSKRRDISISDSLSMHELSVRHNCTNLSASAAPPPYREDYDPGDDVACSFQLRISEQSTNDKQKAVPYFASYDDVVRLLGPWENVSYPFLVGKALLDAVITSMLPYPAPLETTLKLIRIWLCLI